MKVVDDAEQPGKQSLHDEHDHRTIKWILYGLLKFTTDAREFLRRYKASDNLTKSFVASFQSFRLLVDISEIGVLVLGKTSHTGIGSLDRVGGAESIPPPVLPPHVPAQQAVADELACVAPHHRGGGRLVAGCFLFVDEGGSGGVTGAVGDENHGTGDTSLAKRGKSGNRSVRSDRRNQGSPHLPVRPYIARDHHEAQSEADGLSINEPESDETRPSVCLGVREESEQT